MKHFTKEVKIGIAGIVALVLLFLGINFLKGINLFKSSNFYYIKFTNAKGLAKSSPVYADGYNIGIVREIFYDYQNKGNVIVEIQVNDEMRIPKGSSAELVTEILGGCNLNLLLANNPRERCEPGDTLIGTENSGLMDQAAAMIPKVEKTLDTVDSLVSALNRIASDPNIAQILVNTNRLTGNLNQTTQDLNKVLRNDIPGVTSKFSAVGDHVITLTDKVNALNLEGTLSKVDTTMNNLQKVTDKLNQTDNNLGLLLNDTLLYGNINTTIGSADSLLKDLKAHPKRYVHFSIFGRKDK